MEDSFLSLDCQSVQRHDLVMEEVLLQRRWKIVQHVLVVYVGIVLIAARKLVHRQDQVMDEFVMQGRYQVV